MLGQSITVEGGRSMQGSLLHLAGLARGVIVVRLECSPCSLHVEAALHAGDEAGFHAANAMIVC